MILPLTYYGHPILSTATAPITKITPVIKRLIRDMLETMHDQKGCGLAAPQVGYSLRIAVININGIEEKNIPTSFITQQGTSPTKTKPFDPQHPLILINPEFSFLGGKKNSLEEGCLSIPDIRLSIERPSETKVTYQDLEGTTWELQSYGFLSRVLQHEIDHLDGILMTNKANPRDVTNVESQLMALKNSFR